MNNIHVETSASDDERRANLYRGDLFIYTPRSITRELCDLARTMATEAFHPADVLNSRNLDSDLENFEKVGEPMLAVQYRFGSGSISAYYLPAYVPNRESSPGSRLSFVPAGIVLADTIQLDRNGDPISRTMSTSLGSGLAVTKEPKMTNRAR